MSERICMNSMPENLQGSNQKLYRISSLSTLSSLTFGLPELPVIEATILNANKADPPLNFDELGTFPFYMKFIQLLLTIVCAGLHSDGINCIWDSTPGQMLPYVVCAVYMIINTVTIISYVLGQKMPECSLRIFGVIGCLLFAASGAVCLHFWGSYEPKEFKDVRTQILMARAPKMLMSEGFLFLANASLYVIDTCYSLQARRSRYALS